jgi:hypothetical protein
LNKVEVAESSPIDCGNGRRGNAMTRREIESLAERSIARSTSRLSSDQPELQRDLKMAAGLMLLLANLPDVEIDVLPFDHSAGQLRIRPSRHGGIDVFRHQSRRTPDARFPYWACVRTVLLIIAAAALAAAAWTFGPRCEPGTSIAIASSVVLANCPAH